jgi:phosphoglycolate phosphatase-like HAD superfamily hydrolase
MSATMTRPYVLFDLDGTLIDSRAAVTECYRRVFRTHLGQDFPPPEIDGTELFAMRPPELFGHVAPDRVKDLHDAYRATYPSCAHLVRRFAGASELVLALVARGRRVGLVTNKGLQRTLLDLRTIGLDPAVFGVIVTAEDTTARKPDPAPILLGLERAGAHADDAVYVGDGPHDVEAAHAAGMPAIAVTYGFFDRATLTGLAPLHIAASIAELAEVLGLPPMAAP